METNLQVLLLITAILLTTAAIPAAIFCIFFLKDRFRSLAYGLALLICSGLFNFYVSASEYSPIVILLVLAEIFELFLIPILAVAWLIRGFAKKSDSGSVRGAAETNPSTGPTPLPSSSQKIFHGDILDVPFRTPFQ